MVITLPVGKQLWNVIELAKITTKVRSIRWIHCTAHKILANFFFSFCNNLSFEKKNMSKQRTQNFGAKNLFKNSLLNSIIELGGIKGRRSLRLFPSNGLSEKSGLICRRRQGRILQPIQKFQCNFLNNFLKIQPQPQPLLRL